MKQRPVILLAALLIFVNLQTLAQPVTPSPPGKLIDVKGTRFHIDCSGPSQGPSIILVAGIGDYSFDWSLVQARLKTSHRVCSYDRAGLAWSDADPAEPNLRHQAQQLVDLLQSAEVPAPYVLVGHSWGGAITRVVASLIPKDVVGMVLIDSTHEDEILEINGAAVRPRFLSEIDWAKVWAVKPAAPGGPPSGPSVRRRPPSIAPPYTHLPEQAQQYRLWALARPQPMPADLRSDFTTLFASRRGSEYPLENAPLLVITPMAEPYEAAGEFTAQQLKEDHLRLQADLVKLSRKGQQIFAKDSGHHVQLDDPTLVVTAIEKIIQQAKNGSP